MHHQRHPRTAHRIAFCTRNLHIMRHRPGIVDIADPTIMHDPRNGLIRTPRPPCLEHLRLFRGQRQPQVHVIKEHHTTLSSRKQHDHQPGMLDPSTSHHQKHVKTTATSRTPTTSLSAQEPPHLAEEPLLAGVTNGRSRLFRKQLPRMCLLPTPRTFHP